jgi:polar amino acid transport system permease protein
MSGYNEAEKLSWKDRFGHLPWYKRYEFLVPSLLVIAAYFTFLLPDKDRLDAFGWVLISLFCLYFLFCSFSVLGDREKPLWLKNLLSVCIFVLVVYLFFHFTTARWDKLGRYFFNLEIMGKGDPFTQEKSISNWQLLLRGLVNAIKIFFFSAIFSTLLGLFIAVIRSIVNDKVLNFFLILYVDVMRSIPILVMLIVVYSVLPYTGILLSPIVSGILTLSMIQGAYMSEVFRAGIQSIHHSQIEASLTLGLTTWKTMRFVILPQAIKIVLPPYTGYLVGLMKGTALCSQIAIFELLKSAYQVQSWYVNATPLILASLFYLLFLTPLTRLSNVLEKKWKRMGSRV